MSQLARIRRALLSVHDKSDLVPFARSLREFGVEIISTGGTAAALREAGVEVTPVEQITGFPEILDGRVKTLHPLIHGGLLGRRDEGSHAAAMEKHGIRGIDLVCINLYPFERTVRREGASAEEILEQIDIGGPALIRSGSKNHDFVTVVTSPRQYDAVISQMRAHEGCTTLKLRRELAAAAFARTAEYDSAIGAWMGGQAGQAFPDTLQMSFVVAGDLRYGENPHQRAALYRDPASREPSVVTAELLHGKPLSYNNILDAAAALETVQDLRELRDATHAACVVKHTNPCGAAVAESAQAAFLRAWDGDPVAAFGGIVAFSGRVDGGAARVICEGERFIEVIVAEDFDEDAAAAIAARWKNVRMLATGPAAPVAGRSLAFRSVPGGMLLQERDSLPCTPDRWVHAAGPAPTPAMRREAGFAVTVVKHLKSNAVCITRDGALLGAGAGQMDRVASCRHAVEKAGARVTQGGAVAASDAFFPFPDGPGVLIDAGVACIVHPGGSKRDQETLDLCRDRGVTCLLTGMRHFRH
ncbi:MAG: bifunctional phosphoribosylaminoimidazolecarboxamide formyltransferase/IMP cyclohydrolase [Phycisphaerales bacterium]